MGLKRFKPLLVRVVRILCPMLKYLRCVCYDEICYKSFYSQILIY